VGISGDLSLDSGLNASDGTTIWDSTNNHIPTSVLSNDSVTINTSNGLSAGSVSLGNSVSIGISGNLSLDSDLEAVDGETIWDEANGYIQQGVLENTNVDITASTGLTGGGLVSLGGSTTISVADGSISTTQLSTPFNNLTDLFGSVVSVGGNLDLADDIKIRLGDDADMSQRYDSSADSIRWTDETNTEDRMGLDRTTGDLQIEGSFTEGSAL